MFVDICPQVVYAVNIICVSMRVSLYFYVYIYVCMIVWVGGVTILSYMKFISPNLK